MSKTKTAQVQDYSDIAKKAHDDVLEYLIGAFPDRMASDAFRIHAEAGPEGAKIITEFNRHYYKNGNGTPPKPPIQVPAGPVTSGHTVQSVSMALAVLTDYGKIVVSDEDSDIVVKKTERLENWAEVDKVLKKLGFKWVTYKKEDAENTGLWRTRR